MAEIAQIIPGAGLRAELDRAGAGAVSKCYQCATCSSVCDLSSSTNVFPRRQMLLAQWGLTDRVVADPAVWLCHQCADCTDRCPRDVRPGDVLQGLRAAVVRALAFPKAAGKLVANARVTWPLMIAVPWLFWVVLIFATGANAVDGAELHEHGYEALVSHGTLYAVYFPVAGWVTLAAAISGARMWKLMGRHGPPRKASFLSGLTSVVMDIALHKSFAECTTVKSRRTGHFLLLWGFVGAAVTSGLLIVEIYLFPLIELSDPWPLPLWHPYKILGNLSAVALVIGGVMLLMSRYGTDRSRIGSTAFDHFFLWVVIAVIATGVLTESVRLAVMPTAAFVIYSFHLGVVLTLFLTFPYSKFAHMLYRALALVQRRVTETEA